MQLQLHTQTESFTISEKHVMMSMTKPKRQQSQKQHQQEQQQQRQQQNKMENLCIAKMICNKQTTKTKRSYNNEESEIGNMLLPPTTTPQTARYSTITASEASTESTNSMRIIHTTTTTQVDGNCYCHKLLLPLHTCGSSSSINKSHSNKNENNKDKFQFTKPRKLHQQQQPWQWLLIVTLLLASFSDAAEAALRNVNLLVEPPAVRRGQAVALRCDYSLEGAPLYSIKFYRGHMEFYRYTPGEYPHTKIFQYPGIKVDENTSNATQVMIRNVSFGLSGNFSCEVTADAPLYSTATAYAQMQVVEFPEKRPQLFTEHTRYEPGDVLRANCSTPPSRPRADLRFTINNIPVSSEETQYIRTVDNLIASRLSLKVQLQAVHFAAASPALGNNALGGGNIQSGSASSGVGALMLRCTAQIGDLYQEYKEIELGTPQKDPVPARVTLSSGSGIQNFFETYFATSGASTTIATTTSLWLLTTILSFIILQNSNNFYLIGKAFQSR